MSESGASASYPLANRQGRRRRLLCLLAESDVPPEPQFEASYEEPAVALPQHAREPANVVVMLDDDASFVTLDHETVSPQSPGLDGIWQLVDAVQPVTWVFTGDGVTHGARHTAGARCFPELFAERIRWELRRLLDVVVNTGVEGAKCRNLQADLEWRVTRFEPDVVFMTLGLHDSLAGPEGLGRFRGQLSGVVEALEGDGSIVVLNTPNPVLASTDRRFSSLPDYVDQIRRVAEEMQVPVVDHWAHWERACKNGAMLAGWLGADGIHPNGPGHRQIARLLLHRLGLFDHHSPTCNVPVQPLK